MNWKKYVAASAGAVIKTNKNSATQKNPIFLLKSFIKTPPFSKYILITITSPNPQAAL